MTLDYLPLPPHLPSVSDAKLSNDCGENGMTLLMKPLKMMISNFSGFGASPKFRSFTCKIFWRDGKHHAMKTGIGLR